MSVIVGISAYYHDAACCLLVDGELASAAEEERFTRVKHDPRFPAHALRHCLERHGLSPADIDLVAFQDEPADVLSRQLWTAMRPGSTPGVRRAVAERAARPDVLARDLHRAGYDGDIRYVGHHRSHAASAFYFSGFDEAAVLTADGVGGWTTTGSWSADGSGLTQLDDVRFPDSLGLLYGTITAYLGFEVNSDEYKVMGLAPYGRPEYVDEMSHLIGGSPADGVALDLRYFDFLGGDTMYSSALTDLFGQPPRRSEDPLTTFHQDIAASVQVVLEASLLGFARRLHAQVPVPDLCMAGGVALNCVANRRILADGPFDRLFVQPAASDAGGSLGAAAVAHRERHGACVPVRRLATAHLGPSFSDRHVRSMIERTGLASLHLPDAELLDEVIDRLLDGDIIGWFTGPMEFGPRALGGRSIIADPRRDDIRDRLNAAIKKRESFRPFAPAVLAERAGEHFDIDHASPFMLETCQVISDLDLPAITHVDGSARPQTVGDEAPPRFRALLERFDERTGCPILLNTSFNVRGEPIVCTPLDALVCFVNSGLDHVVIEQTLVSHDAIPELWRHAVAGREPAARTVSSSVYTLL